MTIEQVAKSYLRQGKKFFCIISEEKFAIVSVVPIMIQNEQGYKCISGNLIGEKLGITEIVGLHPYDKDFDLVSQTQLDWYDFSETNFDDGFKEMLQPSKQRDFYHVACGPDGILSV